jgi:hypothetical protein
MKNLSEVLSDGGVDLLSPPLGNENHVILAIPLGVV